MLRFLEWTKRKETAGKVELSKQFLEKEKLIFQKKCSSLVVEHSVPKGLVINLDQILLCYFSPGKYTTHIEKKNQILSSKN